jgi:hypothetical protein
MSSFYCYRFNSEAQFLAFAEEEGLITEDGSPILASHEHALDILGTITKGGEYDPETGEVITPPTVLSGWHVNVVGDLAPEEWDQYLVVVNHPVRVFFGGPTQAPATPILEAMT